MATAWGAENVCAGVVAEVGVGAGADTAGGALTAVNDVVGTSEFATF